MLKRKTKYQFNSVDLTYSEVNIPFWVQFYKSILNILPGFFIAIILFYFSTIFLNTPAERLLLDQKDSIVMHYNMLCENVKALGTELDLIARNDNSIYRPFFEADSIPTSVRKAGFGGTDRYVKYKSYQESELLINTARTLDIISKQLYVQSTSYDEVVTLIKDKEKMLASIPSLRPVALKYIVAVCSFGMRVQPMLKIYRMHEGVDLCSAEGTPVIAAGDGKVIEIKYNRGLGNYIKISHGYGYTTVYGHLIKTIAQVGEVVKKGDLIGLVGTTGLSQVNHLHYEVRKNGVPQNPMIFYYWDLTAKEYDCLIRNSTESEGLAL